MLTRSVPRFLLEAAFLIAAAAVAALVHLDAVGIVIVMAVAFALVVLGEWLLTRRPGRAAGPAKTADPAPKLEPERVAEERRSTQPLRAPVLSPRWPPSAEPSPVAARPLTPAPVPVSPESAAPAARPSQRWVPPPAPAVTVPDVPLPPLPPRPARPAAPPLTPPPVAAPAAAPAPPVPIAPRVVVERRRWNVFDLQNRARAIAGGDPARDEEVTFLLLYLREFAEVSGDLSEDFDPFVRESFSELIA